MWLYTKEFLKLQIPKPLWIQYNHPKSWTWTSNIPKLHYEEFENGTGNYTTAIIELEDGTIKNTPVGNVKFIK